MSGIPDPIEGMEQVRILHKCEEDKANYIVYIIRHIHLLYVIHSL